MGGATSNDAQHPREALQDLLDGRLPAAAEDIRAHVASCSACQEELSRLNEAKRAAAALRHDPDVPGDLAAAISRLLDDEDRVGHRPHAAAEAVRHETRSRFGRRWLLMGGVAAAAGLFAALRWRGAGLGRAVITELVARDFEAIDQGALALDVRTQAGAELEAFFAGRDGGQAVPRVRVIDLAMMGFTLEGGRRHVIAGRGSALYTYRGASGRRIVCQMFEGRLDELPSTSDVRESRGFSFHVFDERGLTLVFWQEGSIVCVLAARLPTEDVVALAMAKAMSPA
jgi:anti-sigma factor RsiW